MRLSPPPWREPDSNRRPKAYETFALPTAPSRYNGPMTSIGPEQTCDRTKPNAESPVPHDYAEEGQEYGSLAEGGSYDIFVCRACGRRAYSQLPD